ncbi:MAG: M6 family metalloprotease domain-containing protein [Spirochaetia bacterium]|nr:M6 family metalloprotease domain-containing protein [Spirochaetia bacterium]
MVRTFFSALFFLSGLFSFSLFSTPSFLNPGDASKNGLKYPWFRPGSFGPAPGTPGMIARASVFGTAVETRLITANSSGNVYLNLVIVPVQFSDSNLTINTSDISNLFFGPAYSTVSNYYEVQSYGKFHLSGAVTAPVTLPGTRASYATSTESSGTYARFVTDVAGTFNFTNAFAGSLTPSALIDTFDKNSDGFVDIVIFYHAGEGAETSSSSGDIHSHQYSYFLQESWIGNAALAYLRGTLRLGRYVIVPEIQNSKAPVTVTNQRSTIGTVAHEIGHCLGLVDLYNTEDGSDTAVGNAEMMSIGSYNALPISREAYTNASFIYPVYGKYPAPFSSYNKILLGWLTPQDLGPSTGAKTAVAIREYSVSSTDARACRVKGPSTSEYWLVENRNYGSTTATNFDLGLNAQGLLIWRVNENIIGASNSHYNSGNGINNDLNLRGLRLEPAKPSLYLTANYYPASNAVWSSSVSGFGPATQPAAVYESQPIPAAISIFNISSASSLMSFDFQTASYDASAKITGDHFPSPYRIADGTLSISISLASVSARKLTGILIVNDGGALVRFIMPSKVLQRQVGGRDQFVAGWDGKDDAGKMVNPGLYYYRLLTDRDALTAGRFYVRP